jgi:choline-sulfatase
MTDDDRPNILLIQTDQHNRSVTGCYGDETVRTPNIDRLAAEGMRFENAYCPAPICVPSRMSLMTARWPHQNRVWDNPHVLHSGIPTWAHVLGAAGYETSLVGRMHFDGPDQRHGFENHPIGDLRSDVLDDELEGTSTQTRRAVERAGHGHTAFRGFDDAVTEAAINYLTDRASSGRDRPFAAVVGYVLPHCPFVAPRDLFEYYYDRVSIPRPEGDQPPSIELFRENRDILDPVPEERIRVARAAYLGLCEYVDRNVGAILDCLDRTGLAEDTLVVYCSDHGEMAGEHGCWWKSTYYEGSAGVPLVVRLPDHIEAGTTSEAVVNLTDLGVTFADLAGTAFETPVAGRSLWPTLRGERPEDWADETYSEFVDRYGDVGPTRMVRSGPWKLWDYPAEDVPPALFNLEADPEERVDLGEDPEYAEVREELLEKLYDGWNPEAVARESDQLVEGNDVLSAWEDAVDPDYPERLGRSDLVSEDDENLEFV